LLSELKYITIVVEIPLKYFEFIVNIVVETQKFLKNGKNWRKTDI